MASDQRFQRTVQAVAEAVQTFATGTFDFAESIKQIWGPQTEPDAVETSNPLPIEGMQDVQVVDQLRERTPVSQDGDQLAIHSHGHPPSVTMDDGEPHVLHEPIAPLETANMQLSSEMDAVAGSTQKSVRSCYECFARWRGERPFPPCHSIPGQEACEYCTRIQVPCDMIPAGEMGKMLQHERESGLYLTAQNGNSRIDRQRFAGAFSEAPEVKLEMPLSSPIADVPQQQVGSKRAYYDTDEQQPVAKRQRTRELRQMLMRRSCGGKKVMRQEKYNHGAAEDGESSASSVSASSSGEEAEEVAQIKVEVNRQERSPVKTSYQLPVTHKEVTHKDVIQNDGSSSLTQEQSSGESSSEVDDGYSEEEKKKKAVQNPAAKEVTREERDMEAETAIRSVEESSEASFSSSEDESSEEELDDEPEERKQQPTTKEEPPKEGKDCSKKTIQLSDDGSFNSSSEDGSSDEESDDEPEEYLDILAPEAYTQEERDEMMKKAQLEEYYNESESSSSSSEDESSEEESEDEPEEPKKQPTTKVEPQNRREEKPEEPTEITSDQSFSSSEDVSSEEDSEVET